MPFDGTGLTQREALRRLDHEGPNSLPSGRRRGVGTLALEVAREPMFALLIAAAAIYFVLGDLREALVLAASMVAVLVITIVQQRRTERVLESLRDLSSPRAIVVRDGAERRIAGAEVVRGDIAILLEGDRVAADARVLEASDLAVDESLLTGESVPVAKAAADTVYSGTLVVKGRGHAEVVATGERSELGRIGASLAGVGVAKTRLERETARIVRAIALGGLALCVAVALVYFVRRGDAVAGVLAGLTLAMAILPEEFPVVLTVFLALGAWRIARRGVLTRRMAAIEMLGAATVLCCDKTGTLTENRMALAQTWTGDGWRPPDPADAGTQAVVALAARACDAEPFDPMERAILAVAPPHARALRRHAIDPALLAVSHVWRDAGGAERLAMKGAPESVVEVCALDPAGREAVLGAAAHAAARGLRVLAVAHADAAPRETRWSFAGLVALADPLRPAAPAAIAACRDAGIRVVMITGDHPETARAIALAAGIDAGTVLTGADIAALDDRSLGVVASRTAVFARVRPEQKLRLVNALRASGEVVAMTGDGVNDAPALKAADIGIAMGKRGTDVAREAAALVLLEDDFTAIVGTVRLGRRIYDNIRNAMRYLLAVHVPLAGMGLIPVAAGWPVFLFPVHVVFLEFIIDPACSIAFEAERGDPRAMRRPPRPAAERLFTARSVAAAAILGLSALAAVGGVYAWALSSGRGAAAARAMAFAALVCANVGLIFANRSRAPRAEPRLRVNRALWIIVAMAGAALAAAIYAPAAAAVFRFEAIGPLELAASCAAGLLSSAWILLARPRFASTFDPHQPAPAGGRHDPVHEDGPAE